MNLKWLGLAAIFAVTASANVTFSVSGTYGPSVTTTTYTAPNATFSFTFQMANPPVANPGATNFSAAYTNPVFLLNGVQIPVTGSVATITNSGSVYAVDLFMDSAQTVQFVVYPSAPVFSGSFSSPTIVTGSYPVEHGELDPQINTAEQFATVSNLVIAQTGSAPPSTPAPTSVLLVGCGLSGLALLELLRRR